MFAVAVHQKRLDLTPTRQLRLDLSPPNRTPEVNDVWWWRDDPICDVIGGGWVTVLKVLSGSVTIAGLGGKQKLRLKAFADKDAFRYVGDRRSVEW